MFSLGPIGFSAPWLLLGLAALPILWILLRAVPPAPIKRRFPGVVLLLGLADDEVHADKTPWWLMLLRMLAAAAVIIGFSGPVLNPKESGSGAGPLLVVVDGTWADAADWTKRQDRIAGLLEEASRAGRVVSLAVLTDLPQTEMQFLSADIWQTRLAGIQPQAWQPSREDIVAWSARFGADGFDTYWVSDGLAFEGREILVKAFKAKGALTVLQDPRSVLGLRPVQFRDGALQITVLRSDVGAMRSVTVTAIGLDPNGVERELARVDVVFEAGESTADVALSLPPELRNRISRFAIQGLHSAGAVSLTDDGLRRREVALIAPHDAREGLQLLSPLHYLNQALEPSADLIKGGLEDVLPANPDVIVLADVAVLTTGQEADLIEWVEAGGLLLRFAGPRLAASDLSRMVEDALMPVRLRAGGRSVGGAMSWGQPKALQPFPDASPFFGLTIPADVTVTSQVLAQPDPNLASRVIASLADGTPLVTRKEIGLGQVVLFHVTANAQWSSLPLSGLFVQMLERLAVTSHQGALSDENLAGTTWAPVQVLDGFGQLAEAGSMAGIKGEDLATGVVSAMMPPGVYQSEGRRMAVNAVGAETVLSAVKWPADVTVEGLSDLRETLLKGGFLAAALALLMLDVLASLWLSGRLFGPRSTGVATLIVLGMMSPDHALAQSDDFAINATAEVVLAHVITGDAAVDEIAHAGLMGLSDVLFRRSTIEPANPIAIDLERDELAFLPFLYWPITASQPLPSKAAYAKLNRYLRGGGMIMFDTRDGDIAGYGTGITAEGRKLQQLALGLDIPPLEPVPEDHVLTRSFYLLQDFPGRYVGRDVWVEAAPADAERAEGMPFRNLNDGVTPVIIGGNDWAAAWAVDNGGAFMFRVGRGYSGERQREIAYRFGVNLIMHVLTGNYKSDQVHVPALLDRLGQ
ncbi:LytTR family transcriptional regulator [Marinosulfonomonas sp. PRT-SC04]|nr:LytTR family transcriptional regulator [Marinosulfonomonas sp. PRT-SC04]